ncbi:hypothetical protein SAMN02910292_00717 [Lachnospiraceae bacterium XBB2008]|nr:hypothetical protein SAMN02910292_00717 [Lachnospiraceae bacterium XBB2008]
MSYADRLENNLRNKLSILGNILDSDQRFTSLSIRTSDPYRRYDDYLNEQNGYMDRLDELDREYDEIFQYLSEHDSEVKIIDIKKKQTIITLNRLIEDKIKETVIAESAAKVYADKILGNKKNEIAQTRKNVRVLQSSYSPNPGLSAADHSLFDSSN